MCTSSYTQAFPFFLFFRGCVCTDFRVYSGVGMVGVQLTKYSLDVMREYGRHGEPCNWSQDCVKHVCIRRQRLSLASALLLPDRTRETLLLEFPSSRNRFPSIVFVMPKDCFSKIPLSRWTTHLPVTCWCDQCSSRGCSKTNFGRSHPKNSNWEGKIHCAHVQAQVLYWEQATEAVWLQICPALRVPVPRSFLLEFFSCFWSSTTSQRQNFQSVAPACILCINPTNQMRGHDEARRREASVQSSRPEVGRSIYISISISIKQ